MKIATKVLLMLTLALGACGGATPGEGTTPGDGTSESECPAPMGSCMNETNHAQCLEMEAQCPGAVVQLESCPLQFACE